MYEFMKESNTSVSKNFSDKTNKIKDKSIKEPNNVKLRYSERRSDYIYIKKDYSKWVRQSINKEAILCNGTLCNAVRGFFLL